MYLQTDPLTLGENWGKIHASLLELYAARNEYKFKLEGFKPADPEYATLLTCLVSTEKSLRECQGNLVRLEQEMENARAAAEANAKAVLLPAIDCYAPVSNYYGTPFVFRKDGKFYFGIEDCVHGDSCVEIHSGLYVAFIGAFRSEDYENTDTVLEVRTDKGSLNTKHVHLRARCEEVDE